MVPVENTAGRTAFVFHYKAERTPNKNANQVAHVEKYRYHKQPEFVDYAGVIQNTDNRNQKNPDKHNLVCRLGCCNDVFFQFFVIYLFSDWAKTVGKQLLRTERNLVLYGDNLQNHIHNPNKPQEMKNGQFFKKIISVQYFKSLREYKTHY